MNELIGGGNIPICLYPQQYQQFLQIAFIILIKALFVALNVPVAQLDRAAAF
jgi:hypothetical protein